MVARFGLMHVVATNICVWIRTLVLEMLKEVATYHRNDGRIESGIIGQYNPLALLLSFLC